MLKKEALDVFKNKYVLEEIKNLENEINSYLIKNYSDIEKGIIENIKELLIKIKEAQDVDNKKYISFITYSILRTEILNNKSECLVSAYDKEWYLDNKPVEIYYDASWLFKHIHTFQETLLSIRKRFIGQVSSLEVLKIKFIVVDIYKTYLTLALRNAFETIETIDEFKAIKKDDRFSIQVGEYIDFTESVFLIDENAKVDETIKYRLETEDELKSTHEYFKELELYEGNFQEKNMSYTRFIECELNESNFKNSLLIGTSFYDCDLHGVNFENCIMWYGDFKESNLRRANFTNINNQFVIDEKLFTIPIHKPMNFKNANLSEANFSNANLIYADFTNAIFDETNFVGAKLNGAKILEEYKLKLYLTEEQSAVINWVKGGA